MNKTFRDIGALSAISGVGLLAGMITQMVLANNFGTGLQLAIFFGAQTIPAFVFGQLAFCLGTSFLPVFSQVMEQEGERDAWDYASNFLNSVALVGLVLGVILIASARLLVRLFVPWLPAHEIPLAVTVFQIAIIGGFYNCLFQLVSYLHNHQGRFIAVAAAGLLVNVCMMVAVIGFSRAGIYAVALGLLVGQVLQFTVAAHGIAGRYQLRFSWRCAGSRRTYRAAAPMLGSVAVGKADPVVERIVAAGLTPDALPSLGLAGKIVHSLASVTTSGIVTVIFPKLARLQAAEQRERVGRTLARCVAQTFLLVMPLGAFMGVFRLEVVRFLYEHGKFTPAMTEKVATVALCYSGVYVLGGVGSILSHGFYISGKTHIPATLRIIGTVLYLAGAVVLSRMMGVAGVALAFSLEFVFGFVSSITILRRIYPTFSPTLVISKGLEYGGWAGVSGFLVRWALIHLYPMPVNRIPLLLTMASGAALLGAIYFAGLLLVHEPECVALARSLRQRLLARRRSAVALAAAPGE